MSLFEWLGLRRGDGRRRAAEAKELSGDLEAAVRLYMDAELPDEAARVLLIRADAERSPERRIAFCATAARTAEASELRRAALARKALLSFDLLRARGASTMRSEVLAVARELEEAGELERAADAYALAEDAESEVRVLTAAGAIDRLEERLRVSITEARSLRELDALLRRIDDLDRTAERREALDVAEGWLREQQRSGDSAGERKGDRVEDAARAIRARLLSGPLLDLERDGAITRYALGDEVTLGRGEATIVIGSRAVSRTHACVRRGPSGVEVLDLGTSNGTLLAGARLSGPLPVGGGVRLLLGGAVPCSIEPAPDEAPGAGGVVIEVGGDRVIAPLGDLAIGPWRIRREEAGERAFVVLVTPPGAPRPFLGEFELAASVELCAGDAIAASRGGAMVFRLPRARPGDAGGDAPEMSGRSSGARLSGPRSGA